MRIWDIKGRVLVIAEKPKAAGKISRALSKKPIIHRYRNIPYYEIKNSDNTIYIASALGHLYELRSGDNDYPVFTYEWVPAYEVDREKEYTRDYLDLLRKLFRESDYYVNACDYDIEGSVIGYLLIRFHGDVNRAYRAKFSSLTPVEIQSAFMKLTTLDYDMINAGLCRHELDWIWGINISRALMKAVEKATGKRVSLSAGRVQTPTLKYIFEKDLERRLFIPLPQYRIKVIVKKNTHVFDVNYVENPISSKISAELIKSHIEKSKYLVVESYNINRRRYSPPPPFNLSDLQKEAFRIRRLSPMKTQEIAEQLYLDTLISYPRTNSQKLPPTINYREILNTLSKNIKYRNLVDRLLHETRGVLKPVEGVKEDQAHPAIYPTGEIPRDLEEDQQFIYDLIVRRFLAVFASPSTITETEVTLTARGEHRYKFTVKGIKVEDPGWMNYYTYRKIQTSEIPVLRQGEELPVVRVELSEEYTKPPPQLKKIDVLKWMEDVNIGTESTRALIIEKLFDRKYLEDTESGIEISDLGIGVVEVIEKFFLELTTPDLTRRFETLIEDVRKGTRKRDQVLGEARDIIVHLLNGFNTNIGEAGLHLARRLRLIQQYEKCTVSSCRREVYEEGLCRHHYEALRRVIETYSEWKKRIQITFNDYLSKITRLENTGSYVKDVIEFYSSIDRKTIFTSK